MEVAKKSNWFLQRVEKRGKGETFWMFFVFHWFDANGILDSFVGNLKKT